MSSLTVIVLGVCAVITVACICNMIENVLTEKKEKEDK